MHFENGITLRACLLEHTTNASGSAQSRQCFGSVMLKELRPKIRGLKEHDSPRTLFGFCFPAPLRMLNHSSSKRVRIWLLAMTRDQLTGSFLRPIVEDGRSLMVSFLVLHCHHSCFDNSRLAFLVNS